MSGPGNTSAIRPDSPPWERLIEIELAWANAFEAGQYTDPLVSAGSGERVATRIPDAAVATLGLARPPRMIELHGRGPVVVTDRRVLVEAPDGGVAWGCEWSRHIQQVVTDADGCGALVFPDDDALSRGALVWGVVPPALLGPQPPDRQLMLLGLLMWRRVVAAWRASRGELDAWRRETAAMATLSR